MMSVVMGLGYPVARRQGRVRRVLAWLSAAGVASLFASLLNLSGVDRVGGPTASDVSLTAMIAVGMWVLCLLPAAWMIHGRFGRRMLTELWYDVRLAAWHLHDRRPESTEPFDTAAPSAPETYYTATSAPHVVPAPAAPAAPAKPITIPYHLRASRPESLLLNSNVPPLESDGDVLVAPWAIGAFFDVVQHGFTGVDLSDSAIATARKDALGIGVRIASEIVGTKVPARLRERIEQHQFLVTACVLRHYDAASADQVRSMLAARGHDPQTVWGAANAYLSGYYHCQSWDAARAMAPRTLHLPPPPRM